MALPLITSVALLLLFILAIYQCLLYPIFFSPLAKLPNAHWSAPISRLWILNKRRLQQETPIIHNAHERLGPIVHIAPNEVSVNSVEGGIRTIYSGGYEKGDWYKNVFSNYGIQPMFAMPFHADHSRRKRMLSNIYAKSTLQASASMARITEVLIRDRLVPRLRELGREKGKGGVEFYDLMSAATMDFVSAYVFGLGQGTNYLQDPTMGKKFFRDYKARQRHAFWGHELPWFTEFMKRVGLLGWIVPPWVAPANNDIEAWLLAMCDKAEPTVRKAELEGEKGNVEDWPNVYAQLRGALLKEEHGNEVGVEEKVRRNRLTIASELLDHTLAGFDTSSITLTFLAWELSKPENAQWQESLRTELSSVKGSLDPKDLDALPTLHAILMETLRLHAAIPGNQPRITPPSSGSDPTTLSLSSLPANIRIQSQAWSLHRNPLVFPDPEAWSPARWLPFVRQEDLQHHFLSSSEDQLKEMHRWFWAFGSGGRMCVGSNLAVLDMKAIIAGVWGGWGGLESGGGFRTTVVEGRGMVHNGGYVAEPVGWEGGFCLLQVEEVRG